MSLGGGGYGGGGLPYPIDVLELWGGNLHEHAVPTPQPPEVIQDDGTGEHRYAVVAVGPQGARSEASLPVLAGGRATLAWDSASGADAYFVLRDEQEIAGPLRIEGSRKEWTDAPLTP
jgi:hypothetical protein